MIFYTCIIALCFAIYYNFINYTDYPKSYIIDKYNHLMNFNYELQINSLMNNTELNFALRAQKALNKDYRRLNEGQIFPQDVKVGKSELPATKEVQTRILNIVRRIISCRHAPKQPVTLISPKEQRRQYAHRDYNQRICRRQT